MPLIKQPPPDVNLDILTREDPNFFQKMQDPKVVELTQHANDLYLAWDDFRHRPMPNGIPAKEVWAYLNLLRQFRLQEVPLLDKEHRHFQYWIPDRALQILNTIDRWSGEAIGVDQPNTLPPPERYVISSLMDEAIASSQLEGASTTRKVAKEMLRTGRKPQNHNEQMIFNNWITIQHLRENKKMVLTPGSLLELHLMMTEGTMEDPMESGSFRKDDGVAVYYNHEVVHHPPSYTTLSARIQALCDFANNDEIQPWIHPVVKATLLHFWIGYDHPFVDGNGRTARAVFYWYLLSRGYWLFEYLSISRYFLRAPAQYTRAYIHTETDNRDLTYFLSYNLRVIQWAFQDLRDYIIRKQREIAAASELLRRYKGLNERQRNVVAHALRHPTAEYTIYGHKNVNNVTYQTSRTDLLGLVSRGLLNKDLRGRTYVFTVSNRIISHLAHRPPAK